MKSKLLLKSVALLSLITVSPLLISCSDLVPLPDKERYQRINSTLEKLDYETAGKISQLKKDTGDGVFSPSYVYVEYDDMESFEILTRRAEKLGLDCETSTVTQASCKDGLIDVSVKRKAPDSTFVSLNVTDRYNGRETSSKSS